MMTPEDVIQDGDAQNKEGENMDAASASDDGREPRRDSTKRSSAHFGRSVDEPPKKVKRKAKGLQLVSYDNDDDDDDNGANESDDDEDDDDDNVAEIAEEESVGVVEDVDRPDATEELQTVADEDDYSDPKSGSNNDDDDNAAVEATDKSDEATGREEPVPSATESLPPPPCVGQHIVLPPPPSSKCPQRLQDKIAELYAKVEREGKNLMHSIQTAKKFRNPTIYEKLVDFLAIDDNETNYPPELYNPRIWGPESYYDQLIKGLRVDAYGPMKEAKEGKKNSNNDNDEAKTTSKKPKSKWDL